MPEAICLEKHHISHPTLWAWWLKQLGLAPGADEVVLQLSPLDTNEKAEEVADDTN